MKIYFIEAERDKNQPPTSNWYDISTNKFLCPSLGLLTIASLNPADIEVKIIDEKVGGINFEDSPDAVAISFKTMSCRRAYELAGIYKKGGVKVILGGIHASLLPDEAKGYADSIVVGEGEELWPKIISDLRNNNLQPIYRMAKLTDIAALPVPRYELLKIDQYVCHPIQASRGCSLNCDFCPTREMFGGVFRIKPIKKIIEEIRAALAIEKKYLFFTDDIFCAGDENFTLELLREVRKLRVEFFAVSDFLVLNKRIAVELARSGCRYLGLNLPGTCSRKEAKAIKMMQILGMDIWGYFMFGFRFHEKDVFKKAQEFINETKMRHVSFTVMAPYPNTQAGRKLDSEGRILTKDWTLYDQEHVVCKPEKMSNQELEEGFFRIKEQFGHLSKFTVFERRSWWTRHTGRCLAEISAMLPKKSRKD